MAFDIWQLIQPFAFGQVVDSDATVRLGAGPLYRDKRHQLVFDLAVHLHWRRVDKTTYKFPVWIYERSDLKLDAPIET